MKALLLLVVAAHGRAPPKLPRDSLPPLFLIPSLCGSRIRAWSKVSCASRTIAPGDAIWANVPLLAVEPACWMECMRLWGANMSDAPGCSARTDEGLDSIYNLADGLLGMFAHSMAAVIDALAQFGYDPTSMHAMPYDFRLSPEALERRDGYFSRLKASIEVEVERTGARAVLYAHSMGCKIATYFFHWLEAKVGKLNRQRWLDVHVGLYVANGAPLLGSPDVGPTLITGKTMGLPISQKQIREVLASSGGLGYLLPTHQAGWIRVESWGDRDWPLEFGPEVCCGPGSALDFFEKAAELGDVLSGDIALLIRASAEDGLIGQSIFELGTSRPPIDTVIAAYGVGVKTRLSTLFRPVFETTTVTPPYKGGNGTHAGVPVRREAGLTWKLVDVNFEQPGRVVDSAGRLVSSSTAKSGDQTVPYASLSAAHDWLSDDVRVSSAPLRAAFRAEEALHGEYDRENRAVVQTCSAPVTEEQHESLQPDEEPRITFFESRGEQTTAVWEMEGVAHRDSSNNEVFIFHFLAELEAHIRGSNNTTHTSGFEPEGDQVCYWSYPKAKCAHQRICEYRYNRGDIHLSQSCRLTDPDKKKVLPELDGDCYWDYRRARCAYPRHCEFNFKFGDVSLWDSCRRRRSSSSTGEEDAPDTITFGQLLRIALPVFSITALVVAIMILLKALARNRESEKGEKKHR